MSRPLRTKKQRIIMGIVLREAGRGMFHSIRDLHAMLPYACHYGSFRRSIDFLESHGSIVKERSGLFTLIRPTTDAYTWFSPGE
jgi:hypothetical protein